MSEVFRCEDKDTLVAYLYGEVDASVRREVERHLRTCAACAQETTDLQAVREDLQLWLPPEPALNFTVVQHGDAPAAKAPVLTSRRWAALHDLPAWAQVAAAALFVAAAAAIANVQVRQTADGVIVSTGWMQPSGSPDSAAPAAVTAPASASTASGATANEWRIQLATLEQRLRADLRDDIRRQVAEQQTAIRSAVATPVATNPDAAAVMRRVQSMIEASEERQRQEMAYRFAQAERTWNTRWTTDRATLNRQLGNLQGRTMAVQVGQQELRNQIRLQRVSAPQPNQ